MSLTRTWIVREANQNDSPGLAELFRNVFNFDRGEDHYRWKFFDNPDGPPVISVAEDAGKLVGQYALWPTRMRLGSAVVLGAQSLDTMTHPDYRRQGMFTVLTEHCMNLATDRGVEVLYGFPLENTIQGFIHKLDWQCTGNVPIWIRPLHPSKHYRVPNWASPFADIVSKVLPKGNCRQFHLENAIPAKPSLELLLNEWRSQKGRCRVERTYERFLWRYSENSGMKYRWVAAYEGEHLKSIAIWGVEIRNGNAVLAEVIGMEPDAIEAAISWVIRQALQSDCPLLLAVSSLISVNSIFKRTGFFQRGSLPLIVRKLTARTLGANIHMHELWDIFGADLDTF